MIENNGLSGFWSVSLFFSFDLQLDDMQPNNIANMPPHCGDLIQ